MPSKTSIPIGQLRLVSQQIRASRCATAAEVVATLGAVQAQEYASALWAIGLRLPGSTAVDIERAVQTRSIVRTWPMRGTLHFVPALDVRWMLSLLTPRVVAGTATRVRQLELTDATFAKAGRILERALQGNRQLTREAVFQKFEQAGIHTAGGRGYHIVFRLSMQGLICHGPRAGKQQTFVLLDEWLPTRRSLDRDAALAELARRFFCGHGPATVQDFVWWSGLRVTEATSALHAVSSELECRMVTATEYWQAPGQSIPDRREVQLLPSFDEYLLGYRDRIAVLDVAHAGKVVPGGNGMFMPVMVKDGRVIGVWNRVALKGRVRVTLTPFVALSKKASSLFTDAGKRFGAFHGLATLIETDKV